MTVNKKIVQMSLISVGLFLIVATYFFYPKIIQNKQFKDEVVKDGMITTEDGESNIFENVEYTGFYNSDKPFVIRSEKASILTKEPDIIYMTNMHVTLHMDDGRIVIITSKNGRYNKVTYDCYFEDEVKATDGETVVIAGNLDLLATEDTVSVYNNVVLTSDKGSLLADKVEYNFETKYYQISMFSDKKVKIKLVKWEVVKNLG